MTNPTIKLKWLQDADTSIALPAYQTSGAAGADIRANFPIGVRNGVTLLPGHRALIPTGFLVSVEDGFELQVRPRSGLALKHGVTVANSPGTVDCDYRGPLGVILQNSGQDIFHVAHGDRIAQLVVAPMVRGQFKITDTFDTTERGEKGYGSTGIST